MAALVLDVLDNVNAIDNIVKVIPSYLDRIYIVDTEHFINILSVAPSQLDRVYINDIEHFINILGVE